MRIEINVIPHQEQRYKTCGDWYFEDKDRLVINVSRMNDWRHEALIAVHELIEVLLCKHRDITGTDVDAFDVAFEKCRKAGDTSEPGDEPAAPYVAEHCFATGVERMLAAQLDVMWKNYEEELNKI